MTDDPVVTWEDVADGVLVVTLDRRPANALGPPVTDGLDAALDIMATARQVPADEAAAIGLVDRAVDAGSARGAAAFDLPLVEGLSFEVERIQELFEHGEAREGLAAFLEKRPPKFG